MLDFSKTYLEKSERMFVEDAYEAVMNTPGAIGWLKVNDKPFMFSDDPMLKDISKSMKYYDNHSGASFAYAMRLVEFIAKYGEDEFMKKFKRVPPCSCRSKLGLTHGWCGGDH